MIKLIKHWIRKLKVRIMGEKAKGIIVGEPKIRTINSNDQNDFNEWINHVYKSKK